MFRLKIKKGHDINIAGKSAKEFLPTQNCNSVSLSPQSFRYIKPKLLVKEGDIVSLGDPIFYDKLNPEIKWPAIASGKISKIIYGERRSIQEIIFDIDQQKEQSLQEISTTNLSSKEDITNYMLENNIWPFIKQRPFNKVANPSDMPKSLIVSLANTAPLAINHNFTLSEQKEYIISALKHLKELTNGKLFVVIRPGEFEYLSELEYLNLIEVEGPHPAGNVGVVINHLEPINNKDVIWTVEGHHLPILGKMFSKGVFDPSVIINIAGPVVKKPGYIKTRLGSPVGIHCKDNLIEKEVRIISGNILTGNKIDMEGYLVSMIHLYQLLKSHLIDHLLVGYILEDHQNIACLILILVAIKNHIILLLYKMEAIELLFLLMHGKKFSQWIFILTLLLEVLKQMILMKWNN